MAKWYFTFGIGYDLRDSYVVVEAEEEIDARERFVAVRERAGLEPRRGWSSVYSEQQFLALAEAYRPHHEVPIDTPAVGRD